MDGRFARLNETALRANEALYRRRERRICLRLTCNVAVATLMFLSVTTALCYLMVR